MYLFVSVRWHTVQSWHLYMYFAAEHEDLRECVNQIALYWEMQHCVVCYGCQPISICHTNTFINCNESSFVSLSFIMAHPNCHSVVRKYRSSFHWRVMHKPQNSTDWAAVGPTAFFCLFTITVIYHKASGNHVIWLIWTRSVEGPSFFPWSCELNVCNLVLFNESLFPWLFHPALRLHPILWSFKVTGFDKCSVFYIEKRKFLPITSEITGWLSSSY